MNFLEQPQFITVKVNYFQMPQFVDTTEEDFELAIPALLSNLLNAIVQRHSSLLPQMMATMLILVNETPVSGLNVTLNNGDIVDFVPLVAGG